jgi:hypothetical protein
VFEREVHQPEGAVCISTPEQQSVMTVTVTGITDTIREEVKTSTVVLDARNAYPNSLIPFD